MKRGLLFILWAVLGAVLSYGALYLFTPFGLLIVAAVLAFSIAAPRVDGSRWPEALGVIAGPGLFCFLVAASAEEPAPWLVAGAVFVSGALGAYAIVRPARIRARRT